MQVWPRRLARIQLVGAVLLAAVVFVFAYLPLELGVLSLVPALAAGGLYFWIAMRRYLRRRKTVLRPFPGPWRERLERCVGFYRKLDPEGRRRFERDVLIFLSEQRVHGVRGAEVPDDVKVLVAASGAMLSFGLPDWEWPDVRDVVIYPTTFNEDYEARHGETIAGMVHHQGPIIFSGPELSHGFCRDRDGYNPGLHELAHVMDFADGVADGVPAGVEWVAAAPWVQIVADRLGKVREGNVARALRDYAGKNEAELFAVAVEVFFEQPERLAERDPELFDMLLNYFNVDPRTGKLLREHEGDR